MEAGKETLAAGIAFDKLDLAAVRVAFGAVKTAPLDALDARIEDTEQTIAGMGTP